MNTERDRALLELTQRNPFWVCLCVFALLAADSGARLLQSVEQRRQLDQAQLVQAQNVGRMSGVLAQLPQIEARLQALSLDLIQVARTNPAAAQVVREFNIQWNPPPESLFAPTAPASSLPAPVSPAPANVVPATNASAEK